MRFNTDTSQQNNTWKKQLDYAKKNYKADALIQEKQKIVQEMEEYLAEYGTAASKAADDINKELSGLEKPVSIQQRNLSVDEITQLNYATKVILSRLRGAVAGGATDMVGVLKDIVEQGDTQTRWALVDSIHEVYATAEKLIDAPAEDKFNVWGNLKSQIDAQYTAAMDSLKTPEKLAADQAYTKKKSELETERYNLSLLSESAMSNLEYKLNLLKGDFFSMESEKEVNYF